MQEIRFNFSSEDASCSDYVVNLQHYAKTVEQNPLNLHQKVSQSTLEVFKLIKIVSQSLLKATKETAKDFPAYFKIIVIDTLCFTFGPFFRLEYLIKDIFLCICDVGIDFTKKTLLFIQKEINPHPLDSFKDLLQPGIHPQHFRSNQVQLDTKNLRKEVQVCQLLDFFDAINLEDPKKPCYVQHQELRLEGMQTKKDLRDHLEKFVRRIEQREAFIGTPPAYATSNLHAFYQQLEDTVRLSIQHIQDGLEDFYEKNGKAEDSYTVEQKREIADWISSRTALAIDLAHAGNFCGARYIGEATNHYSLLKGTESLENCTLENHLLEILALKRKEIAMQQISNLKGDGSVHTYNKYMERMGKILGIPGTENIIEHLLTDANFPFLESLEKFLKVYNQNCIIDTIQEEIKRSEQLREKITFWIKDQQGNWNQEKNDQKIHTYISRIQEIREQSQESLSNTSMLFFNDFFSLLEEMKKNNLQFDQYWNRFVFDYLYSDESDALVADENEASPLISNDDDDDEKSLRNGNTQTVDFQTVEQPVRTPESHAPIKDLKSNPHDFLETFSQENLGQECIDTIRSFLLEEQQDIPDLLKEKITIMLKEKEQIKKMRALLPRTPEGTLKRFLRKENNIKDIIENELHNETKEKFLELLQLENMAISGISDQLMEWLLVSHKIFLPQSGC